MKFLPLFSVSLIPQMAPMNWFMLFSLFNLVLTMVFSKIHFLN